jgi:hypothetical protein
LDRKGWRAAHGEVAAERVAEDAQRARGPNPRALLRPHHSFLQHFALTGLPSCA